MAVIVGIDPQCDSPPNPALGMFHQIDRLGFGKDRIWLCQWHRDAPAKKEESSEGSAEDGGAHPEYYRANVRFPPKTDARAAQVHGETDQSGSLTVSSLFSGWYGGQYHHHGVLIR